MGKIMHTMHLTTHFNIIIAHNNQTNDAQVLDIVHEGRSHDALKMHIDERIKKFIHGRIVLLPMDKNTMQSILFESVELDVRPCPPDEDDFYSDCESESESDWETVSESSDDETTSVE